MMKKILFVLIGLVVLSSCEKQKIAYVDNSYVINEYQEKKDVEAKYKIKIDAYNQKRDSIGRALQMEYQQFQVMSKSLAQEDAQSQYDLLMQKQQAIQQQFQYEEQQIAKQSQTEIDSLISKLKTVIKKYGKDNNYAYILGTSEVSPSIMYGNDENNLSETILEVLNKNYKKD